MIAKRFWVLALAFGLRGSLQAADLAPPEDFKAFDTPNDGGKSISLTWRKDPTERPDEQYAILGSLSKTGPFVEIERFGAATHFKSDAPKFFGLSSENARFHFYEVRHVPGQQSSLADGTPYFFMIRRDLGGQSAQSKILQACPAPNWFNGSSVNVLLTVLLIGGLSFASIQHARRNPHLFIRRIPGLDAIEEAIGRATEMGRSILYLNGLEGMSAISTIASTSILGNVASKVAAYDSQITVPCRDPIVMTVCKEVIRESYLREGRPDAFREDSVFFVTEDQFAYVAAVDGIMLRDKPAANLFMGYYYAEALLLAETGAATGAIQIAGTDSVTQLPFFIASCDYTLIGEELYAASAYLSRDPLQLGSLRGADLAKGLILFSILIGVALSTSGSQVIVNLFRTF